MKDCIEFKGCKDKDGYGKLTRNGKTFRAHKYTWEQVNGPVPNGLIVRHVICNNPPCVNVKHLALGTTQDNVNDKIKAGHQPIGEKHGISKLTECEVIAIKKLIEKKVMYKDIAAEYNVSPAAIGKIANGKTWGWLNA